MGSGRYHTRRGICVDCAVESQSGSDLAADSIRDSPRGVVTDIEFGDERERPCGKQRTSQERGFAQAGETRHADWTRTPRARATIIMRRSQTLIAVVFATATWLPRTALADNASEAELQFELGSELYKQGRYVEAIDRFVASNRLVPNPNVVLNVARTFAFLKRPVDAYNWYSNYLSFDLSAEPRAAGESARAALAAQVAVVDIETDPAGADVFIDRLELGSIGKSPRKVALEPGQHRLIVRLANYRDTETTVELAPGQTRTETLRLAQLTGKLSITTVPAGALVHIEPANLELGRTPIAMDFPIGEARVKISMKGYLDQSHTLVVVQEEPSALELKLARDPSMLALLSVRGNVPGAEVFLDSNRLGVAPLTLNEVEPGSHKLEVRAPNRQPWSTRAVMEAGAATRVDFKLVDPNDQPWQGWRWLGYGLGGALLAGGAVSGLLALQAHGDFEQEPSSASLERTDSLNAVADALFISGAVVVSGTLVWDLLTPPPSPSRGAVTLDR